ncbi:MAG TPA: YedE-related selenium metabolism membrane protein [Planctomycetes bacterium]|nr:YedE-related selenium metabolism membrane protein [Planctomycetota bacterium]
MRERITRFFASSLGIIIAGALIGIGGVALQALGNPANMGICAVCFQRDIAGALGLHRASAVQYIRPEIIGFVLGALLTAFLFREFKPRGGSAPLVRFVLGAFAVIGALAFLGCPWRAMFRLAGGDLNALTGVAGLALGIAGGVFFLARGYSLGRAQRMPAAGGLVIPLAMAGLLLLLVLRPRFGEGGPVFFSEKGPGSMHAPLLVSLGVGLLVGFLAQRTRFCTMGAVRDVFLMRDTHLLRGVLALLVAAFAANLALGKIDVGFAGQPIAHAGHVWNFLGMALAGLAFALGGGCPGRQLFLSGEGDGDAGVFVLGMVTGAAFSHNFALAGKADAVAGGALQAGGLAAPGQIAVVLGLVACVLIGACMREK